MGCKNMKCPNCTGIARLQWLDNLSQEVSEESRQYFMLLEGEGMKRQLEEQYCRELCPRTKFERKYHPAETGHVGSGI
jgi:hypothetical protein